jgi:hypothetical protein
MVSSTTADRLRQCLKDIDFPANRQDLLDAADRNDCDEETLHTLRGMPPETYTSIAQVTASVTIADDRDIDRA